jgi:Na+/phosphate symporter
MKDEHLFYNPFRMLSPKLDHEIEHIEELHERPVSQEISLEEGLLVMISKLIEMCRLLSKCLVTGSAAQMDRCEELSKDVHHQEKILTRDLVESKVKGELLKGLIRFPYRLERIGDMFESILNCCRIKAEYGVPFSDKAYGEMDQLFNNLLETLNNLRDAIRTPNKLILEAIVENEKKLNEMFEDFKLAHWLRLEAGFCAVEASSLYRDILDSVKSVNDYLVKMSRTLLELGKEKAA